MKPLYAKGMSPDYKSLQRKLRRGVPLEDAALEAGIPLDQAQAWVEKLRADEAGTGDERLLLFSNDAINTGITCLKAAIKEKNRKVSEGFGEGMSVREAVIDIDAAKALLKFGFEARRMIDKRKHAAQVTAAVAQGASDLFDLAASSPWRFKERE